MKRNHNPTATRMALNHYVRELRRNWRVSVPALVLPGAGHVVAAFVPTLIIATAIERFNGAAPTLNEALPYLWLLIGAWLVGQTVSILAWFCINYSSFHSISHLYTQAMQAMVRKDITFFHNNFAGSLTKKVLGYGRNFEMFMNTLSFHVFGNLLPLLFTAVVLWAYSPLLVGALLGLTALVLLAVLPFIRYRSGLVRRREDASNAMAGYVADVIGNMDAVQAFAREGHEVARHTQNVRSYMQKALRSWNYQNTHVDSIISPSYTLINAVGLLIAIMASDDGATMAAIFVTFNYFALSTRMLWDFNHIYRNLETAITDAAQFTELLLDAPAVTEAPDAARLKVMRGAIDFKGVDFTYHGDGNRPLFTQLNLRVAPGEKVALVGHSGGGKTTITKLLLRFADITGGELLIDGQNIAGVTLASLRGAVAYVPQEPLMFHRSIRENIRYGNLQATDEQVVRAAKQANAHEFIMQLPAGYDTLVGERGVKLSGGQRQRVAIARALIKDAPILVLDEATSALDSESEKLIQEALWKLMEGRTTIVIAHRLSTIQRMDRIVVLDTGNIIEEGSHKILLKKKGTYWALWSHQSGGFIDD